MKSSEALASRAPPTKSICSACCFDVRVVVPSSRRLATRFASPALSGGSCAEPVLISAWISTMGRKCCSRTSTVMPFAVTNFVGAISAATLGPLAMNKAQSPITRIRVACRRGATGRCFVVGMIRAFPVARPWRAPLVVWETRESVCRRFDCPPSGIGGRHAEYLWWSPPGSVRQTDRLFATRRRRIQPVRATWHAGSWSPVRKHGSASTWFFARWSSCSVGGSA